MILQDSGSNLVFEYGHRVIDLFAREKEHFDLLDEMIMCFESEIIRADCGSLSKDIMQIFTHEEVELLREAYCYWETSLEAHFSTQESTSLVEKYRLYNRFKRLVLKEIGLLGDSQPRSILFIGSGPFPVSALLYNRYLEGKITCLDSDVWAVEQSQKVLGRCNRDKPIEVLHGKGEAINGARFDLIIVALLAAPKDKILANLSRTISPTTNVICRTSEGARQLLYRPLVLDREAIGFTRLGIQHAQNDDTISSLLFMKSSV